MVQGFRGRAAACLGSATGVSGVLRPRSGFLSLCNSRASFSSRHRFTGYGYETGVDVYVHGVYHGLVRLGAGRFGLFCYSIGVSRVWMHSGFGLMKVRRSGTIREGSKFSTQWAASWLPGHILFAAFAHPSPALSHILWYINIWTYCSYFFTLDISPANGMNSASRCSQSGQTSRPPY